MKNKISIIMIVTLAAIMHGCNIDPEYYSQVYPETFFDSQDKVYQRFARPFSHWATTLGTVPRSRFTATQTLCTDEIVMPNRNGDWYDGGFYMNLFNHSFAPGTDGYWNYAWEAYSVGVAQSYSAMEDIDKYVDFKALGFPEGTRESMLNQLKTLVAFFYLQALDHFGGVPLYSSNGEELKGRASEQETFEFIEKLLKEALPALPAKDSVQNGKITRGVAASLLARLYFNAQSYIKTDRYSDCAKVCQDIIDGVYGTYATANSFQDIFGFDNEKCNELIWVIPSNNGTREVHGGQHEYAMHYGTRNYLNNSGAESWNGMCLVPSLDSDEKSYKQGASNPSPKGQYKLGSPYAKFEDTDLRKKNYLYIGDKKYEGMFLHGKLVNRLTGVACVANGEREFAEGDTVAMVDQIAQLSPNRILPEKDKDGKIIEYWNDDRWLKNNPPTIKPVDSTNLRGQWRTNRYSNGRYEGAMYAEENSGVRILKFSPIPNAADNSLRYNPDIPVIRLTEIIYTLAECEWRAGNKASAAQRINNIRKRYFESGNDPNPVPSDFDEYRLLDEWLIEFIGEGRRRIDLIRHNKFTTEAWWDHPADNKPHLNRFPIPSTAINANSKLEQNPGYY